MTRGLILSISIVLALIFSIPWYWPKGEWEPSFFGLPAWAFVSVVMSALFAALTSCAVMLLWDKEDKRDD